MQPIAKQDESVEISALEAIRSGIQDWTATAEKFAVAMSDSPELRFAVVDRVSRLVFTESGYDVGSLVKNEIKNPRLEYPGLNCDVADAFVVGNSVFSQQRAQLIATHCVAVFGADAAPYRVIDVNEHALAEVAVLRSSEAQLLRLKWKRNEANKIDSYSMEDGKEIVAVLLDEMKLPHLDWVPAEGVVSPWDYMRLNLGGEKLSIGVSAGGVVSVDGRSHAPDDLACNMTMDAVRRSLRAAVPEYLQVLITNADTAAFEDIGHAQEGARILRELADHVRNVGVSPRTRLPLKDANGNEVGFALHSYSEHLPEDDFLVCANLRVHLLSKADIADMLANVAAEFEDGRFINKLHRVKASAHEQNLTTHLLRCLEDGWCHVHQDDDAAAVFKEAREALDEAASNPHTNVRLHDLDKALKNVVKAGSGHIDSLVVSKSVKDTFASARQYSEMEHVIAYDGYTQRRTKVLLSNDGKLNGILSAHSWPQAKLEVTNVNENSLDAA